MFPDANIPVVQLSIQNHLNPLSHLKLGRALNDLKKRNILIIGSGGSVHPLGYPGAHYSGEPSQWAKDFDNWLTKVITEGNEQLLINYRELAPYPKRATPILIIICRWLWRLELLEMGQKELFFIMVGLGTWVWQHISSIICLNKEN